MHSEEVKDHARGENEKSENGPRTCNLQSAEASPIEAETLRKTQKQAIQTWLIDFRQLSRGRAFPETLKPTTA